jgi:hypothetical protein
MVAGQTLLKRSTSVLTPSSAAPVKRPALQTSPADEAAVA